MKEKLKKQNAITLIALIITIVVMLILVGVSVSIALDENGIIAKAKQTSKDYNGAIKNDLIGYGSYNGKNITGYGNLINAVIQDNVEDDKYENIKIGDFVELGIDYTNVNGTVPYYSEYLSNIWDLNGQTGWRVLSKENQIALVAAGSPLTYYVSTNMDENTINNMEDLKKSLTLVETGTDGFVKNGFSSNDLGSIFSEPYINQVRTITVNDFMNTYKHLSGCNTATIETIYDNAESYPFKTSTLLVSDGNKMEQNAAEDLLCNGFFYILNGVLVNEAIRWGGEEPTVYSNFIYDATGSGFMRKDYSGEFSVRPVVILDEGVTFSTGDGSFGDPHVIDFI